MTTPLLNASTRKIPEDGFYQLVAAGETPVAELGLTQVVDADSMNAMVAAFAEDAKRPNFRGLLIDADHASSLGHGTAAQGWVTGPLQVRADGLWGKIDWTPPGLVNVEGGVYSFISPTFRREDCVDLGGKKIRPTRLVGAGLTNRPRMKMISALTNALGMLEDEKTMEIINQIATALHCEPDKVLDGVTALVASAAAQKVELDAMKADVLNSKVAAALEDFKDVITNAAAVKTRLLADFDGTMTTLQALTRGSTTSRSNTDGELPNGDPKRTVMEQRISEICNARGLNPLTQRSAAFQAAQDMYPDDFRE